MARVPVGSFDMSWEWRRREGVRGKGLGEGLWRREARGGVMEEEGRRRYG